VAPKVIDHPDAICAGCPSISHRRPAETAHHPTSVVKTFQLSFARLAQANEVAVDLLHVCAFLAPDAIPEELFTMGASSLGSLLSTISDSYRFNETLGQALRYSLLSRQPQNQTISMYRLVQAVLRDGLDEAQAQLWRQRAVQALHAVLPPAEPLTWVQYERLVPHALVCTNHPVHSKQCRLQQASLLFKTASYLFERAQNEEAEALFLRALHIREQLLHAPHPDVAHCLNALAQLYRQQGQLEKAELLYQRALHIFGQALDASHPDGATPLNNLATLSTQRGNYTEAEALFQRALSMLTQAWGPQHPDVARSLNNLALLHHAQGQTEQAERLYQRALSTWEQLLNAPHPAVTVPLNNLAHLYRQQERFAEAEPLYQRVLFIWEQTLRPSHPSVAYALVNLITLYTQQGRFAEAEPLSHRAWDVWKQTRGSEHSLVAYGLRALKARGTSGFGQITLTPEKYGHMLLLHPHALNGFAKLSP